MYENLITATAWLEQHLMWALLIVFVAVNSLVLAVMVAYVKLYGHLPEGPLRDRLHKIVYEIDQACDALENPATLASLVTDFQQVLGWKRYFVPAALIRWIIAVEVACVRKMQETTGIPNLHQEVTINAGGNAERHPNNG